MTQQYKNKGYRKGFPFFGTKLNLLEIKQIIELEQDYKKDCMAALKSYKHWLKFYEEETDLIEVVYGDMEGKILRRRAEDLVNAYWVIRQDLRKIIQCYFEKNIHKTGSFFNAKNENPPVFLNVA